MEVGVKSRRVGGYALPWLILGIAVAAVSINYLIIQWIDAKATSLQDGQTSRVLAEASSRLENWYISRPSAGEPSQFANAATVETISRESGIDQLQPKVRLARAARRFSANSVAYSRFLLWLPPSAVQDATGWDTTANAWAITNGAVSMEFNTLSIQMERYARSLKTTQILAKALENWFEWQRRSDPAGDIGTNYFRARDCVNVKTFELECLSAFTDVSTTSVAEKLGLTKPTLTDAWQRPLQLENMPPEVGADLPPFAMRVRFVPPGSEDQINGSNLNLTMPVVVTVLQRL